MKPFNILALSFLFPNSVQPTYGIFVLNRLNAIKKYCNVKVIAPVQWYPLIQKLRGNLWKKSIPIQDKMGEIEVFHPRFLVIPRYLKWIDAITFFIAASRVEKQLKANGFSFDLVDVHWTYPDIVAGYILAHRAGKKFIVTIRGHEAFYEYEKTIRRWLVAFFLRRADAVIALSDELCNKAIRLGVDPMKIQVILNGVDLSRFYPLDRSACRRQLGLPQSQKILLSVGRLTEGKGHKELILALSKLSKGRDISLYIIGGVNPEEDFSQVLAHLISNLRLDNIHLIEAVSQDMLCKWYNAADLFCLATKREGCPNVLLESLACGTPAVVTNVGSVGSLIIPGENGFMVSPQQPDSLADIILSALEKRWNHDDIARRMKDWSWSHCAQQVIKVYKKTINNCNNNTKN